jgi:branched-chain amino acid transport system ATP-binding protein
MADEMILETRKLRRAFGALVAVDDVDLKVEARTLHSIIGPNGAGKTTLFNLLSGNLAPVQNRPSRYWTIFSDHQYFPEFDRF